MICTECVRTNMYTQSKSKQIKPGLFQNVVVIVPS